MPKYLIEAIYNAEGLKGIERDGAARRAAAVRQVVESLGGKLEWFYFAFGETDAIGVMDMPDTESAAAWAVAGSASGLVRTKTTALISVEEMGRALEKAVTYHPPGSAV